MKPEHTKPFNLDHARSGARYCCRDGRPATILKWDGRCSEYPLIGYFGEGDSSNSWTITGYNYYGDPEDGIDLVMIPLGTCEGKPVWWDSELVTVTGDIRTAWQVLHFNRRIEDCVWPVELKPDTSYSFATTWPLCHDNPGIFDGARRVFLGRREFVEVAMLEKVALATIERCKQLVSMNIMEDPFAKNGRKIPEWVSIADTVAAIIKAVREGK